MSNRPRYDFINKDMFDNLETTIQTLYVHGAKDDFTSEGMPKVSVVNHIYTGKATRAEIDKIWKKLYGHSTAHRFQR